MTLKQKIIDDFKQAFRDKDDLKKSVLGMMKSEISNKEIDLGKREEGLNDEEVIAVLKSAAKKRKDSASQFRAGGREELAEQEEKELAVISGYLPEQMGAEEIEKKVGEIAEKIGAKDKSQTGMLMGAVMKELGGAADGNEVRKAVEKILSE